MGACRGEPPERPPSSGAGTYVLLTDSSRALFVIQGDGRSEIGVVPGLRGFLTLEEDSEGFLLGSGSVTADLSRATLGDSSQTRALLEKVFEVESGRENRTARLRIRQLFGKRFKSDLPPGGVTPLNARAQLVLHGHALSNRFEGEISRTPTGYRITTAAPIILSIEELALGDELEAWREATGFESVADGVAITVDLRLARRDAPAKQRAPGG